METKICTKCKAEKDVQHFFKRGESNGKHRYRSRCKKCCADDNHINNKNYYKKNFDKNSPKRNEAERKKYAENSDYRNSILKRCSERYKKNRALFCKCCNKELPKHSIKYCDGCRDEVYKQHRINWKNKVGKEYINDLQRKKVKRKVEEITDGYVAQQIRHNKFPGLKLEDIPKELIELKRSSLKLKRELNKIKKHDTSNTEL